MTRDEKGRFAIGNGGGPGRPKKDREQEYQEILVSAVTSDDWRAIVVRAVGDAKKGDTAARKFLADYLIGPPVQKTDVTSDGEKLSQQPDYSALTLEERLTLRDLMLKASSDGK